MAKVGFLDQPGTFSGGSDTINISFFLPRVPVFRALTEHALHDLIHPTIRGNFERLPVADPFSVSTLPTSGGHLYSVFGELIAVTPALHTHTTYIGAIFRPFSHVCITACKIYTRSIVYISMSRSTLACFLLPDSNFHEDVVKRYISLRFFHALSGDLRTLLV